MISHTGILVRACILLIAGLVVGCGEETEAPCVRPPESGVIAGTVRMGDLRYPVRVDARQCASSPWTAPNYESAVPTDAEGRYQLDLPPGPYVLEAAIIDPLSWWPDHIHSFLSASGDPDTFRLAAGERLEADLILGGLRLEVSMPPGLEERFVDASIYRADCDYAADPYACSVHIEHSARITGGRATFHMAGVRPGSYKVLIEVNGFAAQAFCERFWLPASRRFAAADTLVIAPDRTLDYACAVPAAVGRLEGSITGCWSQLRAFRAPRPRIRLVCADSTLDMGSFSVPDDGSFDVSVLLPEPARVRVDWGDRGFWVPDGCDFWDATVFSLEPGATQPTILAERSGLLLDLHDQTYTVRWSAACELVDPVSLEVKDRFFLDGDPENRFHPIVDLVPGDYLLHFDARTRFEQKWRGQWFDRRRDPEMATIVTIPPAGSYATVRMELEAGGRIRGTLTRSDSGPWRWTMVYLTPADDPTPLGSRIRRLDFRNTADYDLPGLEPGGYRVGACLLDYGSAPPDPPDSTVWYPGTNEWSSAEVIVIEDAEEWSGVDFVWR